MAALAILKNTNQETVVKVYGIGTVNITLDDNVSTGITATTQELIAGGTPKVNIVSANWSGLPGSTIEVTRNTTSVIPITGDQPQNLDLAGQGYVDNVANTEDISVEIAGADAVLYLVLRKIEGWATKVETATYGAYDDETRVGASTTMDGSPDKV